MSAEHEPRAGADQHEPLRNEQSGSQPFRLAAEGAFSAQNPSPLPSESVISHQYDASLEGGAAAGKPPFTPGTPPDVQPSPPGHTRRNILLAAGAALAGTVTVVGTLIGFDRMRSDSGQDPDNEGVSGEVTQQDPTKTKSPEATNTPNPTDTPVTATKTVESTDTPSPINNETSEETRNILERYYLEVGEPINTYGKTTFAVSKPVQERENVCVPNSKERLLDCRVNEVYANTENVPDADERIDKAYSTVGLYLMWNNHKSEKPAEQQELALDIKSATDEEIIEKAEEFRRRVDSGEDFTFTMAGYDEKGLPGTVSKDIVVNPIHGVKRVSIPTREGVQVIISTAGGVSYTAIDGHLIIGTYGSPSEGIAHLQHPADAFIADIEPSAVAAYEIAIAAYPEMKETLKTMGVISFPTHGSLFKREFDLITRILIPDVDTTSQYQQSGSIVAR